MASRYRNGPILEYFARELDCKQYMRKYAIIEQHEWIPNQSEPTQDVFLRGSNGHMSKRKDWALYPKMLSVKRITQDKVKLAC